MTFLRRCIRYFLKFTFDVLRQKKMNNTKFKKEEFYLLSLLFNLLTIRNTNESDLRFLTP